VPDLKHLYELVSKDDLFCIEDGAVFAAEFVDFFARSGFPFDGAALAQAYSAGHHLLSADEAIDILLLSESGNCGEHWFRAACVNDCSCGVAGVIAQPVG